MSKRIVCVLLALIMLVGLIPAGVITASAASNRTVSENAIKFIKEWEGFSSNAYWDNSQYSYGYGTVAPNGLATITEEEADKALREELKTADAKVNSFAATHGKNFSQQQHDALVSFTYNCGWGWMSQPSYRITKAVINGSVGNEFLQAMALWSNVDSIPQAGLVSRRMAEADMYLNGSYTKNARGSYTYVTFDANGGVLGEDKVQAYDYNVPVAITSVPTREGYTFLGWYTKATEGVPVTTLNSETSKKTVFAHWQHDESAIEDNKTVVGTPASYTIMGSQLTSLKVYSVPNSNTASIGSVNAADSLKVTAEYVDENNIKWVKISSGWVTLGDVKKPVVIVVGTSSTVTVTNAYINIRKNPNTDPTNAPIGTVKYGDKLVITEVKEVKGSLWGKFEKGWIALMYTDYNSASASTPSGSADIAIAEGTVSVTNTNLNVRTGAGTDKALVGTLTNGTKVKIYEITTVGGHSWGRIGTSRWVCLDYVVYKDIVDTTPDYVNKDNVTQNTGVPFMFTATVNADGLYVYDKAGDTGVVPVGSLNKNASVYIVEIQAVNSKMFGKVHLSNAVGWIQLAQTTYTAYGKVDTTGGGALNVREGAGSSYAIAKKDGKDLKLENGTAVTILELKANGTGIWARVKEGWISMDHVALNTSNPPVVTTPSTGTSTGDGNTVIMTGVVNSGINLNVRLGAGVGFDIVNSLPNGTQVKIYEKQLVNGHYWGKMGNNAWVCLSYITDTTEQTGLGGTTGNTGSTTAPGASAGTPELKGVGAIVYNCTTGVNIRTAPGTNSALAGSAPVGSRVTVYEQKTYNGALWARTDEGWISMLYLKLDTDPSYSNPGSSVTVNGLFAATVLTNELPVYDAVNGGTAVVTLVKGNVVYVTELQSFDGTTLSGKVTVGGKTGWIDLSSTAYSASGVVATKEGGTLNVRSDAKADASVVEKLNNGSSIKIVALKSVKSGATTTIWGKIAEGKWVAMEHVNIVSTTVTAPSTGTSNTSSTSYGVIYNAGSVNVRSAAGVKNPQVATLMKGTQVIVHEETVVDDAQWVRISTETVNGWVAKQYVSISYTMNNGGNSTGTGTVPGTGTGTETAPSTGSNYATGYVNSNIPLNIRSLPDVNSPKVGELTQGMTITIYEQQAGGGLTWGRVDKGWVALNYVTITSTGSTGNGNMGTIIKAFSKVNVRSMPGTGNAIVGEVMVNSRVEILDQQMYNGAVWYRISNGWVAGEYVELDAPFVPGGTTEQAPGDSVTGDNMTNTDTGANDEVGGQYTTAVLKHPGNDVVKFYADDLTTVNTSKINGTTVVITALKGVGTEVWANTSFGWFNLSDEGINFIAVGTVNTKQGGQLNVRSTAGITSDEPVAKLDNKSSITITAVKVANGAVWGKMAKGWVSLEHLALTASYNGVQGATGGTNVAEIPASVSGKLFNATIKTQHLTINVYDKADGKVVGFVEAGQTIRVNQVVATMSGIWGKTATNAGERWVKLSDLNYTIDDTIAVDCTAYTSAGGTASVGTFKKGDAILATNLIAVGDEIYAQITSGTNTNGWVNIKEMSKWYVAPAVKDVESAATVASDVIFSSKVSVGGAYFYKDATTATPTGSMAKDTVVLVKSVKVSAGEVWAEIHVFVTAPDMSVTAATRWTKLSYLSGGYTVAATAKQDVYLLKGTSYASYGSDPYKTVLSGEAVTITSFVMAGDGTLWAKIDYSVDGVAKDAYIQAQYLTY